MKQSERADCYEIFAGEYAGEQSDYYLDVESDDDLVEAAVERGRYEYRRAFFSYLDEACGEL